MSAILRWFHDGDVRYHAYFRTHETSSDVRELIVASRDGRAVDLVSADRTLEDFSTEELLAFARRVQKRSEDAAAD